MQDRPTVTELLEAVRGFLEDDAMPALDPRRRFLARVAANVLAIIARELDQEDAALAAEWASLAPLTDEPVAPVPEDRGALRARIAAGTAALVERIRRGDVDEGPLAVRVRAHVRETVRAKLRVANPGYLAEVEGGPPW